MRQRAGDEHHRIRVVVGAIARVDGLTDFGLGVCQVFEHPKIGAHTVVGRGVEPGKITFVFF